MPSLAFIVVPVLLALYYAALVATKPRVPQIGSIVVRYEAPQNLTPAAARYVWKGCVDERTVACVLAGLATKGRIALHRIQGGYEIRKTRPPRDADALNTEEQSTLEWLFSNFLDSKVFHPQRDSAGCISSLRGLLDRELGHVYRNARYGWAALGMLASFSVSMMLALYLDHDGGVVLKFAMAFFLTTFMTGVVTAALLVPALADLARGIGSIGRLLFASAIAALPVAGAVRVAIQLVGVAQPELAIMIFVLVAINMIAVPLLRNITEKGIDAQRQIVGFREFLLKVEQDKLDRVAHLETPPPSSVLSYAIALEVKEAWGDELANACFGA